MLVAFLVLTAPFMEVQGARAVASLGLGQWEHGLDHGHHEMGCLEASHKGLLKFLTPQDPVAPTERQRHSMEKSCKAVPWHLPDRVANFLRALPPVKFLLDRFEESPAHKAAFLETHHFLATDNTMFLSLQEGLGLGSVADSGPGNATAARSNASESMAADNDPEPDVSTTPGTATDLGTSYQGPLHVWDDGVEPSQTTRKIMPFWVKGDPGTSNPVCYTTHFITYIFSWFFVGAFLLNFFNGMRGKEEFDIPLGGRAVLLQMVYGMIVIICGLAEEVRTTMDPDTRCNFHKRYIMNFAYACILGIMFQVERKKARDAAVHETELEAAVNGAAEGDTAKGGDKDKDDEVEGGEVNEENDTSGASLASSLDALPLTSRSLLPFIVGLVMSLLMFTLMC